jgi:hypothetical protein
MTTLDNSAVTAFAVWACSADAPDTLWAVFASYDRAVLETVSLNSSDDVGTLDWRVAPVTYTA